MHLDQARIETLRVLREYQEQGSTESEPPVPAQATALQSEGEVGQHCLRCQAHCPDYFRYCFNCGSHLPVRGRKKKHQKARKHREAGHLARPAASLCLRVATNLLLRLEGDRQTLNDKDNAGTDGNGSALYALEIFQLFQHHRQGHSGFETR